MTDQKSNIDRAVIHGSEGPVFIDFNTRNKSFLKMWKTLKALGIKNNKFFLMLFDKGLSGVDPHAPNLSHDHQVRIAIEVAKNPWYFMREVVRIPVPGGFKKYELHRGNLALTWCMLNNFNIMMELPRQNGKTISTSVVYAWIYDFGTENSQMTFGNKELKDAELNLKRLKDIREQYPAYLKFEDKKDTNNIQTIRAVKNSNSVVVMSSANDEVSADKLGRGTTTPIVWWDEFAFLKFNEIVYASASPAQSQAQIEAKSNGKPYGKLCTTTPNNLDRPEGRFCREMMDKSARFEEELYDWSEEQIRTYIKKNSENDFVYIKFMWNELGRDANWLEDQKRALNNDLLKVKREILLEWTYASDVSPFTEEQLETIAPHIIDTPEGKLFLHTHYPLSMLEVPERWDLPFLVGVDVSGGLSRDASAIEIAHPIDLRIIATFRNNRIDTRELSMVLIDLCKRMPNAVLIIENNSMGKGVIDNIKATPYERNMYYEYRRDEGKKKVVSKRQNSAKGGSLMRYYGINTNSETRERMIKEVLYSVVEENPDAIRSPAVFNNIRNLERKSSGKIEHRNGEHDDNLMAYMMIRYAWAYGKDLPKFMRWPHDWRGEHGKPGRDIATNAKRMIMAANGVKGASILYRNVIEQAAIEEAAIRVESATAKGIRRILGWNR